MSEFRLLQNGDLVALVAGEPPLMGYREIMHYAVMYAPDGPVEIQEKISGRWKKLQMFGAPTVGD